MNGAIGAEPATVSNSGGPNRYNQGRTRFTLRSLMSFYDLSPREAPCPACRHEASRHLWDVTAAQAAQHYVLRAREPERHAKLAAQIEKLWGQGTCEVLQCGKCGFCFAHPFKAGDAEFYGLAYDRAQPDSYPQWKWEFEVTLEELRRRAKPEHRLLELGAGDGAFLRRVRELIPPENLLATEFSEYGRGQIEGLGVECLPQDVRDLDLDARTGDFDYVCLFQVLEHLDGLDDLFAAFHKLLKPGGRLYIGVPDGRRIEFHERSGGLLDMPPNHVGRWSRSAFEAIGPRHGFRLEDWKVGDTTSTDAAKLLIKYRYLRQAQLEGSFASRVGAIRSRPARRAMQVLAVGAAALTGLPAVLRSLREPGKVQWAHMVKE